MSLSANLIELLYNPGENQVDNTALCVHCHALRLPMYQKAMCGCRLCEECLAKHKDDGTHCPGNSEECATSCIVSKPNDSSAVLNVFPDNAMKREIYKLIIKCPYCHKGCPFVDSVRELVEVHLPECQYQPKICDWCQMEVVDLNEHKTSECSQRPETCPICKKQVKHYELASSHITYLPGSSTCCSKRPFECPDCHKVTLVRDELNKHLTNMCPKRRVECRFKYFGCLAILPLDEMEQHCSAKIGSHMSNFIETVCKEYEEYEVVKGAVSQLEQAVELVKAQGAGTQRVVSLQDSIMETLNRRPSSESQFSLPEAPALPPPSTTPIVPNIFDFPKIANRTGKFLWRISNFREKQSQGVCVESDDFYTDKVGYRLRLRCYPYGNGSALGHYLSLYFVIVADELDDLLEWPMRNRVSLEVLRGPPRYAGNREVTWASKKQIYCMGADTTPFMKPPRGQFNAGMGNPKFMELREVNDYIMRDSIFIRCTVQNG